MKCHLDEKKREGNGIAHTFGVVLLEAQHCWGYVFKIFQCLILSEFSITHSTFNSKLSFNFKQFILIVAQCQGGFQLAFNASKCFYISTTAKNWSQSHEDCKALSSNLGRLAEVRDAATYKFLQPQLVSGLPAFVIFFLLNIKTTIWNIIASSYTNYFPMNF